MRAGAIAGKELLERQIEQLLEQEKKLKEENDSLKDRLSGIQEAHDKEMHQLSTEFRNYEQEKMN